jgi:hypothetical protein
VHNGTLRVPAPPAQGDTTVPRQAHAHPLADYADSCNALAMEANASCLAEPDVQELIAQYDQNNCKELLRVPFQENGGYSLLMCLAYMMMKRVSTIHGTLFLSSVPILQSCLRPLCWQTYVPLTYGILHL